MGNQHTGKSQTGKYQRHATMEQYAKPTGRTEHATEDYRLGKDRQRQRGFDWNYLGRGWNNRGQNLLLFGMPSNWIPCGYLAYFRLGKIERIFNPLFFFGKNTTGIIALRINYASIAENATEKIAFCWIKSALAHGTISNYGKTKALKCVLRHGKTIVPSRTSAEKLCP